MGRFQISESVQINRPAAAVFAYLCDMSQIEAWRQNIEVQDYSGDPFGVGSSWKDVTNFLGRDLVANIEITAIDEGRGFTMKQETEGFAGHATWNLTADSEESCTATLAFDGETSGWFAGLASGLMRSQGQKRMRADLDSLKANLESG